MIRFFVFCYFKALLPFTIIMIAKVKANPMTATPVKDNIIWLNKRLSVVPNVVSIVDSKVNIDTAPAIKDIFFAEE